MSRIEQIDTRSGRLGDKKMTGQKPLTSVKAGLVSAALWENEAKVNGKTTTMLMGWNPALYINLVLHGKFPAEGNVLY